MTLISGWNLPSGCHRIPGDEPDSPCAVCGRCDCICPTCPICFIAGDPVCYERDHLVISAFQIASKFQADETYRLECEADAESAKHDFNDWYDNLIAKANEPDPDELRELREETRQYYRRNEHLNRED